MMQLMDSAFRPYYKPMMFNNNMKPEETEEQNKGYSDDSLLSSSTPGKERVRRKRTTFTPEQATTLETEYVQDRYMDRNKRTILAQRLNLHETQVKTWFQNRRAKDKKEGKKMDDVGSTEASSCHAVEGNSTQPPKRRSTESPTSSQASSGSTSALVAALNSPASSRQSPSDMAPTPPCHMTSPPPPAAVSLPQPLPAALPAAPLLNGGVSYADYLSSFGLNPLASITTPTPYPSIYDLYANYTDPASQGKSVLSSMLDSGFFQIPQTRDLAQL